MENIQVQYPHIRKNYEIQEKCKRKEKRKRKKGGSTCQILFQWVLIIVKMQGTEKNNNQLCKLKPKSCQLGRRKEI